MSKSNRLTTNSDVFAGLGRVNKPLVEDGNQLEDARMLPIEQIQPNPNQPRKKTNPEKDKELAADIDQRGILQPIIVRPLPDGKDGQFQIVAGERRWRAARQAGLEEVPVIIKELDDQEASVVSLVENLQRLDLEQADEAEFFRKLSNDFGLSNRQIAKLINRSHGYVDQRLKPPSSAGEDTQIAKPEATQATPIVHERSAPIIKGWRYRPQNFRKISDYIIETIENWEQVRDDQHRENLLQEVASLKEELEALEKKLVGTNPQRSKSRRG